MPFEAHAEQVENFPFRPIRAWPEVRKSRHHRIGIAGKHSQAETFKCEQPQRVAHVPERNRSQNIRYLKAWRERMVIRAADVQQMVEASLAQTRDDGQQSARP